MIKFFLTLILICVQTLIFLACSKEKGVILKTPSRAGGALIIASQDTYHRGVTRYGLDGTWQELIHDYRNGVSGTPRGLALGDSNSIIVALEATDQLDRLTFSGESSTFYGSSYLSGAIYDVVKDSKNYYYVIESNYIERFNSDGVRTNPTYIATTVGSCTLSVPLHMIVNSNGYLVVVQIGGGGRILTYDISTDTASCVSSVAFGNTPYGLVEHSDGYLYVVTQGNDQIYRADPDGSNPISIWSTDTSIINNPTTLLEHPDGDLIVASSSTNTIEKIKTDGTRVGTTPFISDVFTRNIFEMLIIPGTD